MKNYSVKPLSRLMLLALLATTPALTGCPPSGPVTVLPGPVQPIEGPDVPSGNTDAQSDETSLVTGLPESTDVPVATDDNEDELGRLEQLIKEYERAAADERDAKAELLVDFINSQMSGQELRQKYEEFKAAGRQNFPMGLLGFKLAKVLYHIRDYDQAKTIAQELPHVAPYDEWNQRGIEVVDMVNARLETASKTIGVLMPLSGRYKLHGEKALAAINLAMAKYPEIKLIVRDTEGKGETAAAQVQDLVLNEHVIAIIGPLTNTPCVKAAQKAEELEVPIILQAFQAGLPEMGTYVFRNALTAEQQAEALSDLAFNKLNYKKFAILHPRSKFGQNIAWAFWDEIDNHDGEVRGYESYPPDESNYQVYLKKMVGRYYLEARPEYWPKVHEIRAMNLPPHRETALLEKEMKAFPPVVDFDALFIPDSSKAIGLIAPTVVSEDIIITRDKKELERIKKATGRSTLKPVTLFGSSQWNSPETIMRGGRNVEGSVFVDNFYLENPDSYVIDFVQKYREEISRDPLKANSPDPTNSEAQAFDSAAFVAEVILHEAPANRAAMRQALIDHHGFKGLTGLKGFAESGEAARQLYYFTIKDQLIKLMDDDDLAEKRQ